MRGFGLIEARDVISFSASATFRLNFPEAAFFEGPVSALTAEMIMEECGLKEGELDCLIGGPPCQSFSYNNHHRSEKDERARLFEHYLRIVRGLKPKTIVMENVPGILTIGGGSVVETIKAELERDDLGYKCDVEVLSAEEYGTPQVRRRVFIVASRIGDARELLPVATHRSANPRKAKALGPNNRLKQLITISKAIGDLPPIKNGGAFTDSKRPDSVATSNYQREMRKGARKLLNHACHGLTSVNLNRIVHVPQGGNWRDIPRDLLPAGMQRAKLTDHTKRYGRLHNDGLASTLLTKCDPHWGAYVHPTQDRTISVREAARLQGFPDSFLFSGMSLGRHYEQVGNAVPVPVARAIGMAVSTHLTKPKLRALTATPDNVEDRGQTQIAA